jgi:hypothetical protein
MPSSRAGREGRRGRRREEGHAAAPLLRATKPLESKQANRSRVPPDRRSVQQAPTCSGTYTSMSSVPAGLKGERCRAPAQVAHG